MTGKQDRFTESHSNKGSTHLERSTAVITELFLRVLCYVYQQEFFYAPFCENLEQDALQSLLMLSILLRDTNSFPTATNPYSRMLLREPNGVFDQKKVKESNYLYNAIKGKQGHREDGNSRNRLLGPRTTFDFRRVQGVENIKAVTGKALF